MINKVIHYIEMPINNLWTWMSVEGFPKVIQDQSKKGKSLIGSV